MKQRRVRVRITKRAAHGESGKLRGERLRDDDGKIFEVDGRKIFRADIIKLDIVARGDAEQSDLFRRAVHGNQTDRLLERQRSGGDLRADDERERPRLRRVQGHAQLARVGIKPPERNERLRICIAEPRP